MRLLDRFARGLDYFVPDTGLGSPEDRRRARLAIGMALLIAPVMAVTSLRILIIDDDERVARSLQRVLTGHQQLQRLLVEAAGERGRNAAAPA
jgi:PleD family two-component response regulator